MSTKIYNAYKCKLGFYYTSLIVNELRLIYSEFIKEEMKTIPTKYRKYALKKHNESAIVIYPLPNGEVLFQIFMRENVIKNLPLLDLLITFNKIQDYHYQNQSDPYYAFDGLTPDELDLAEADYQQRELDWNLVLGNEFIPAESGFTIPLVINKFNLVYQIK